MIVGGFGGNPLALTGADVQVQKPQPGVSLQSTQTGETWSDFRQIGGQTWIVNNAWYNSAIDGFQQINPLQASAAIVIGPGNSVQFATAPIASTSPITWTFSAIPVTNIDVYNVQAYGATGNGTTDDSVAINACIAAAPTGSTIYFPEGTYLCDAQTILARNDLTFTSLGQVVITGTANPLMQMTNANSSNEYAFSISNFVFMPTGTTNSALVLSAVLYNIAGTWLGPRVSDCQFLGNPNANVDLIKITNTIGTTFSQCNFYGSTTTTNAANTGLLLTAVTTASFCNCQFFGFTTGVVQTYSGSPTTADQTQGISYDQCNWQQCGYAIQSTLCFNYFLVNCQIDNCSLAISGTQDAAVTIKGCWIACYGGAGTTWIDFETTNLTPNTGALYIIEGNFFYPAGAATFQQFIKIGGAVGLYPSGIIVKNNLFYDIGGAQPQYVLALNYCQGADISHNQFYIGPASGQYVNVTNQYTGAGYPITFRNNLGLNPFGNLFATPAFPTSGTVLLNNSGYDVTVYVAGGTITTVYISGSSGAGPYNIKNSAGVYPLPSGGGIEFVYTGTPTWYWVAN